MSTRLLVFLADTHGGHKLSLMNPATWLLDDELQPYQPQLSSVQQWLWGNYESDIAAVERLADGERIDVVHVGDVTWGQKYGAGLVSTRMADQIIIGSANLAPWLELPNVASLTIITGTDSHELGEASAPILLTRELRREYPQAAVTVAHHSQLDADGYIVDAAHHGPTKGKRVWLDGNELRRYTQSLVQSEINAGQRPPDLVVRAHTHDFWPETVHAMHNGRMTTTEAFICPAYAGLTPYARQVTQSISHIGCGIVAVELADSELRRRIDLVHSKDLRVRVAL